MSKTDFSKAISGMMHDKAIVLESSNPLEFFKYDEYLELVLCIAYMTLSKEKIIKKEIKNEDKLGRLTKMVSTKDIDLVFDPSFNPGDMPHVTHAEVWDNLWILDNIRDSIMHGQFTVDFTNKCFNIKNEMEKRGLEATVPFSWFIKYTQNDIFKKKIMDEYTVSGFFYDNSKKDKRHFRIPEEIYNHIFYNVHVSGNKFNVIGIEKEVKELFRKYMDVEITAEDKVKYRRRTLLYGNNYKENYLISFFKASDMVKEELEKKYPNLKIEIHSVNRKQKLVSKLSRNLDRNYKNYDLMFDELEYFQSHRSDNLINALSNIISGLTLVKEKGLDLSQMDYRIFNFLIEGKDSPYTKDVDIYTQYRKNLDILKILNLNAYAISTLVINHEGLYTDFFGEDNPINYHIEVLKKEPLLKNLIAQRTKIKEYLEKRGNLVDKENQIKCVKDKYKDTVIPPEAQAIIDRINADIASLTPEIEAKKDEIWYFTCERGNKLRYNINDNTRPVLVAIDDSILRLEELHKEFLNTKKDSRKEITKKIVEEFNHYMVLQLSIKYWVCDNMKDALVVIRNSFSHIARMTFGGYRFFDRVMLLNDYETEQNTVKVEKPNEEHEFRTWKRSGQIIAKYSDMVSILNQPLQDEISLKKTL